MKPMPWQLDCTHRSDNKSGTHWLLDSTRSHQSTAVMIWLRDSTQHCKDKMMEALMACQNQEDVVHSCVEWEGTG